MNHFTQTKAHVGSTEAAFMLGIPDARVHRLLGQGWIQGAIKQGGVWMIPLYDGMPVVIAGCQGPKGTWYKHPRQVETHIVVNRTTIGLNTQEKKNDSPIVVKLGKHSHKCHELDINGSCRLVYMPHKTGPCSACAWIEVTAHVLLLTRMFSWEVIARLTFKTKFLRDGYATEDAK